MPSLRPASIEPRYRVEASVGEVRAGVARRAAGAADEEPDAAHGGGRVALCVAACRPARERPGNRRTACGRSSGSRGTRRSPSPRRPSPLRRPRPPASDRRRADTRRPARHRCGRRAPRQRHSIPSRARRASVAGWPSTASRWRRSSRTMNSAPRSVSVGVLRSTGARPRARAIASVQPRLVW